MVGFIVWVLWVWWFGVCGGFDGCFNCDIWGLGVLIGVELVGVFILFDLFLFFWLLLYFEWVVVNLVIKLLGVGLVNKLFLEGFIWYVVGWGVLNGLFLLVDCMLVFFWRGLGLFGLFVVLFFKLKLCVNGLLNLKIFGILMLIFIL